jgi:hypothetical protein
MDHVETVLRRAAATKASAGNTLFLISWFKGCIDIEHIHPLEGGFLRLKYRRDRRSSMPVEPIWQFYPRYWWESASKLGRWAAMYVRLRRVYLRIKKDPKKFEYTDLALTPVADDEAATHELFQSSGAKAYIDQEQRLEKIRQGTAA